jgi:hypothetical protein
MTTHLGFYNTSSTRTHVRFQFSTHASAGGNVAPLSAFEAADLRIYRAADGAAFSATQRSSSNGITMTSPFDSLTGYHDVDIDLTDNTDAGFYASGYLYLVVLAPDTETIDSQTITGIPLEYFEIGVAKADMTQILGTAVSTPATAGVLDVNVKNIDNDAASASGTVTFPNATLASTTNITAGTITTVTNLTNAPTNGDLTAAMKASVNAEADTALSDYGALKPTTAGRTLDVTATGEAGIDWANIGGPTTTQNLIGTTVKTATDVETDTQDIQSRLPAALTGAGNIKADVLALSGDATAADNLETMLDGTGGQALSLGQLNISTGSGNAVFIETTQNGMDAVAIQNALGNSSGAAIYIYSQQDNGNAVTIDSGNGTGDALFVGTTGTGTGKSIKALNDVALPSGDLDDQLQAIDNYIDTEIAAIVTAVNAIKLKTDNLPSDPADDSDIDAQLAAIQTAANAIKAKTDSLTFTVAGEVDANVQSINDAALTGDGSGTPWGPA